MFTMTKGLARRAFTALAERTRGATAKPEVDSLGCVSRAPLLMS